MTEVTEVTQASQVTPYYEIRSLRIEHMVAIVVMVGSRVCLRGAGGSEASSTGACLGEMWWDAAL